MASASSLLAATGSSESKDLASASSGELPVRASVSRYGITWEFERAAPVGHFVNGDFHVVGPVTITNITPRPLVGPRVPISELAEAE
jgi:hypothetical protein